MTVWLHEPSYFTVLFHLSPITFPPPYRSAFHPFLALSLTSTPPRTLQNSKENWAEWMVPSHWAARLGQRQQSDAWPPGECRGAPASLVPSSTTHNLPSYWWGERCPLLLVSLEQLPPVPEDGGEGGPPATAPWPLQPPPSSLGKHWGCPPTYPAGCNHRGTSEEVDNQLGSALSGRSAGKPARANGRRRDHPAHTWQWVGTIMDGRAQTRLSIWSSPALGILNLMIVLLVTVKRPHGLVRLLGAFKHGGKRASGEATWAVLIFSAFHFPHKVMVAMILSMSSVIMFCSHLLLLLLGGEDRGGWERETSGSQHKGKEVMLEIKSPAFISVSRRNEQMHLSEGNVFHTT